MTVKLSEMGPCLMADPDFKLTSGEMRSSTYCSSNRIRRFSDRHLFPVHTRCQEQNCHLFYVRSCACLYRLSPNTLPIHCAQLQLTTPWQTVFQLVFKKRWQRVACQEYCFLKPYHITGFATGQNLSLLWILFYSKGWGEIMKVLCVLQSKYDWHRQWV